ncbi:hypothetical protein EVAR_32731_1 [Eumeta japonica]|uniref:Uncharacterized protein n=1 Tax=Eumeta variegata TaxID=151549 RepID=A0A4C1XPS9_EUMVA|nr:hypothetical protein EVAR_32731_1 [Eumeta japonica]
MIEQNRWAPPMTWKKPHLTLLPSDGTRSSFASIIDDCIAYRTPGRRTFFVKVSTFRSIDTYESISRMGSAAVIPGPPRRPRLVFAGQRRRSGDSKPATLLIQAATTLLLN